MEWSEDPMQGFRSILLMDASELYNARTSYAVFNSPISAAASFLTSALKVRQILPSDIAAGLDSALRLYHSASPALLSTYVLRLFSELSAQDAPLILSKTLIGLAASMKAQAEVAYTQSSTWFDTAVFTTFFNEHWKALSLPLLPPFSALIDLSAGPPKPEYQ